MTIVRKSFCIICLAILTLTLAQPALAAPVDVTYVGTWNLAPGSGNSPGVGGPGMSTGQRFVIRLTYDDTSNVTNNVDVLTEGFTPSGNLMSTVSLQAAGNSLDIFVPMEGFDAGSPFIYAQNEGDHFPAFIPVPTLNFVNGSFIGDTNNIIGLEFEGDFVLGAQDNVIELFNTSAGAGQPINMVSQILNLGEGIAIRSINSLSRAVDLIVNAGPDLVYSANDLTVTTSSFSQNNDLGAGRSDGEDFIVALWDVPGIPVGNDILVSIADSGLTNTIETATWNVTMQEQMTLESGSDSLIASYMNATPTANATATPTGTGYDFSLSFGDDDLVVNSIIVNFDSLVTWLLVDGAPTAFFDDLISTGFQSSTNAELEAAFGSGMHTLDFSVFDLAGAGAFTSANFEVNPIAVEICTLVTLNPDMVSGFTDADAIMGDGCDAHPQNIPVGVVSSVDGTYRLKVTNTGSEALTSVRINAPDFGLVDAVIPCNGGRLNAGEKCQINFGDPGFPTLKMLDVCVAPGLVNKIASVDAEGATSAIPVSDDDPASVECVSEPDVVLRKQVSLDGGPFLDADSPATGPSGQIGDDAEYRLIVENAGTETLINAEIDDPTLGLANVPVPGGPMAPGDIRVIDQGDAGFRPLLFIDRCDSVGNKLNIATANAEGEFSGAPVSDDDPAYVNCEDPMVELLKQVSLDGINFFDANLPGDPDVPVGIVDLTNATYRLIARNTGTEVLTNVLIEDPTLGISTFIADLLVGETRVLESGDAGFGNLFQPMRCGGTPGNKSNIASVSAAGALTGTPVSDDDPANVRCILGPEVQLLKQVALDGVNYVDADTPQDGPTGLLGADAIYRLIVRNVGDEDLTNVTINDTTLGISGEAIPDLPIGAEVVVDVGSFGTFDELFFPNRCDSVGAKLNIAEVLANGDITGTPVQDDNPAFVNCENPDSDNDGVLDGDDVCPGTVIPEGVPTRRLGKNRWALVDGDWDFDTRASNGHGPRRGYSTTDTAGCSCEQVIAGLGLDSGHTKFGCSISAMNDWMSLVNP